MFSSREILFYSLLVFCPIMTEMIVSSIEYKKHRAFEEQMINTTCVITGWFNNTAWFNVSLHPETLYPQKIDVLPWPVGSTFVCWWNQKSHELFTSFRQNSKDDKINILISIGFLCFFGIGLIIYLIFRTPTLPPQVQDRYILF